MPKKKSASSPLEWIEFSKYEIKTVLTMLKATLEIATENFGKSARFHLDLQLTYKPRKRSRHCEHSKAIS